MIMGLFSSGQKQVKEHSTIEQKSDVGAIKEVLRRISLGELCKVSADDIKDKEIAELLNTIMSRNISKKDEILHLNSILNEVVKMVEVKTMVEGIETQSDTLQSMSASSEQLSASVEDVAQMTLKASEMASELYDTSQKGSENISKAMDFVKTSFEDIESVNLMMSEVKKKTETINQIVDIVKGIADQTNLLALNAAIEAASLRFRPILMTSLAFGAGVIPLIFAQGAGAVSRQEIGLSVFGGVIFGTVLVLIFIPFAFVMIRTWFKPKASPTK